MLSQRVLSNIFRNGCYLMCCMRIGDRSLDELEGFVNSGYVRTDGYVYQPDTIAKATAVTKQFEGSVNVKNFKTIAAVDGDTHFVILKPGVYTIGQSITESDIHYNSSDRPNPVYKISSFRIFS